MQASGTVTLTSTTGSMTIGAAAFTALTKARLPACTKAISFESTE